MLPTAVKEDVPVVELRGVHKTFAGPTKAVDNVSLAIRRGETIALLGPSGCGKTTTLRLINRLTDPDPGGGEVLVRGAPVTAQKPERLRRSIGYVIQDGGLFPHLSVRENVATLPRLLGWSRGRIQSRVEEVLNLVGLPPYPYGSRKPEELSGGQRQRVGVARALAGDPDLLLMDEPFSALDPVTREELQDEFLRLQQQLHKTVIFVSHDMLEAGKLATRIVLMNHGRVAQEGSVGELLFHPQNEFVRDFLAAHRQQMAFETLAVDDLLDEVEADPATHRRLVEVAGARLLRDQLILIAGAPPDTCLVTLEGRHAGQRFSVERIRRLLFEQLLRDDGRR